MTARFDLQLLDQYWITGSRDPFAEPEDTTSHGKIALLINGVDISGCEDADTDYGINQSAAVLLQSVFVDHIPVEYEASDGVFSPMFFHGCSILGTCPNCVIDFRVRHVANDEVILDQFYVNDALLDSDPRRFHDLVVQMPNAEYAKLVLLFGQQAAAFLPPSKGEDYEIEFYEALRRELLELIALAEKYLHEGRVTPEMQSRALAFRTASW